jgi:hypothetical protein
MLNQKKSLRKRPLRKEMQRKKRLRKVKGLFKRMLLVVDYQKLQLSLLQNKRLLLKLLNQLYKNQKKMQKMMQLKRPLKLKTLQRRTKLIWDQLLLHGQDQAPHHHLLLEMQKQWLHQDQDLTHL